ncbi:F-box only protein 10 [Brienomyrus brachyistius]|uniref:F-box only protein 10 n=1 Tax=Brienomyrus brachyistius TaxID=42636 RepID=UPI0020B396C3|nr:F-box only protein 10 [Brienomyrus brachyistius]
MDPAVLPVELWRVILGYLPLPDLGRCSQVCRAWRELILSLDKTLWRQLCLRCPECRHPNWPNRPDVEPQSWREALRQHTLASRTWTQNGAEVDASNCLYLFRRRKDRRVWHVGVGCELESLRGALSVAGPFDRIVLQPGVYEEQTELLLKLPVEIVGRGRLGEVALLVSIEQQCPTARLCNLVLMPAWFSPVIYKTSSGHVQLDNCNVEGGQLQVRGPGTCQARFCSFGQASGVHFQSVALSLLDSCDFSGSDGASVTVDGPPVSDRNWAFRHLAALARACTAGGEPGGGDSQPCSRPVAAAPSLCQKEAGWDSGRRSGRGKEEALGEGTVIEDDCSESEPSDEEEVEERDGGDSAPYRPAYRLAHSSHGLSHLLGRAPHSLSSPAPPGLSTLQQELQEDGEARALVTSVQGCLLRGCLFRDGKGGVLVCNHGHARLEANVFRTLTYAVRCIQNAKIVMLRNEVRGCRATGVFFRLASQGLVAENNIHSNAEAGMDIRKGANPIVLCNRIHSGLRSGIVVLGNGKGSIRGNQIYGNKEAGIYILYNGNPAVSGNHIFQGQAAGIAVNENGKGLIVDNVICENQWGGADIRKGGDPVLRNNFICYGYSDGVVVGERGRGLIEGNYIYCNRGCGVWVMSSSLPQLSENHITHNRIYGVAVFCQKDSEAAGEGYLAGQGAAGGLAAGGGGGANENFNEEGEMLAWESDLDSEDERYTSRRLLGVALLENNLISCNGAVGLYVKTSEALNLVGNAVHSNGAAGVALMQSAQLSRLVANCICANGHTGVQVAAGCRAELRGNGVYDNGGHGISARGDGLIVENDVVGNRGCGVRLMEPADLKVLRNRIQPVQGCGILVLENVKGLVQENVVYQGRSGSAKPLVRQAPGNSDCLLLNNTLLFHGSRSAGQAEPAWALEDPPPRPHFEGQGTAPTAPPSKRPIAMATRISARVESGCHSNGSILCSIL